LTEKKKKKKKKKKIENQKYDLETIMKLSQIKKTRLLLILLSFFMINCPTEKKKDNTTTIGALAVLSSSSRTGTGTGTGTATGTGSATPTITNFLPTNGIAGVTSVVITGTNFSTTAASNTVNFNGVTATVTSASSTSLTVTVPSTATTGTISVTTSSQTATSASSFTVGATALTIGAAFTSGTLTSGNKVYYSFSAAAGSYYTASWDDSFSGSGTYTADIYVKVLRANGTTTLKSSADSGYYPSTFDIFQASATETVYIEVSGFSTSSGTFGVRIGQSLTWAGLTSGTASDLYGIACPGSSTTTCVVVGGSGLVRRTTDGNTWSSSNRLKIPTYANALGTANM
jgi:hypothetical protein